MKNKPILSHQEAENKCNLNFALLRKNKFAEAKKKAENKIINSITLADNQREERKAKRKFKKSNISINPEKLN